MAGKIVADTIESAGSQISLNVGNVTILTASSTGLTLIPTTNVNVNLTNSIVTLTNGSATSPGLTFSGNTRTGLFMPSANTLAFTAANTESMRIDSSGNVGIGYTSMSQKLQVNGNIALAANTGLLWDTNGSWQISSDDSTYIRFVTSGSEKMRIDTSGNLLVGCTAVPSASVEGKRIASGSGATTSSSGSSTASYSHWTFFNGNGSVGSIQTSASATSFNTSSDYRLKENIAPMTGALSKVALLKPVTYTWKSDGSAGQGFIAHELAEVEAGCVTGEKDAVDADGNPVYQGIDTSFLVATLTAAIQELKAIVDAQAVEIAALKAK